MLSEALIDFDKQCPEAVRGIPPRPRETYNWDALEVLIDHTTSGEVSRLKKQRLKKDLMKGLKLNGVEALAPPLRYNYCRARLALGDFSDFWGWEFRDAGANGEQWSAHLYWEETWLPKYGIGLPFEGYWPGLGHVGHCNRLLILGEQGVGDAVFIASLIPEVMIRCKEVIFECDERLHSLFERSFPGLICKPERKFEDRREDYGHIDAFIPSFELMRAFRQDIRGVKGDVLLRGKDRFPGKAYLKPDPKRVAEMEKHRGKIGVAWKGRQGSIDPRKLDLYNTISVQYRENHPDFESPDLDLFDDIEGIVALCSVLEKVVTVPQSIHHFAGAVGTKVEIIQPEIRNNEALNLSPWDYSTLYNGGRLLWYPDARVFEGIYEWKRR